MPQPVQTHSSPRRGLLQALGAGAGAAALAGPASLLLPGSAGAQPRDLILRKIPRTGETIIVLDAVDSVLRDIPIEVVIARRRADVNVASDVA